MIYKYVFIVFVVAYIYTTLTDKSFEGGVFSTVMAIAIFITFICQLFGVDG